MVEILLDEAEKGNVKVVSLPLPGRLKGLYADNTIAINTHLQTTVERTCILAEELGHYYTTAGNILDQSKLINRKQEHKARRWAVRKLIKIEDFIRAFEDGIQNRTELAEFLEVTESFIALALKHFRNIYGYSVTLHNYIIVFDPLYIYRDFEGR